MIPTFDAVCTDLPTGVHVREAALRFALREAEHFAIDPIEIPAALLFSLARNRVFVGEFAGVALARVVRRASLAQGVAVAVDDRTLATWSVQVASGDLDLEALRERLTFDSFPIGEVLS